MRIRRPRRHAAAPETAEGDLEQILEHIRAYLPRISATSQDIERQLNDLQTQIDQIDGIAQRLALLGLVSEGVGVLEHQAYLSEQRLTLAQQQEQALATATRLRSAEYLILHRLEYGEDEPERPPAPDPAPAVGIWEEEADHDATPKPIELHG